MAEAKNVYLIGMMGCGKTTVGKLLAQSLNWNFIDTDAEIISRTGVDIPTIFEIEGEVGFRQREKQIIAEMVLKKKVVMATGGGAILNDENRVKLCNSGTVVYLAAQPKFLFERTRNDHARPLLLVADPLKKISELVAQRDPIYREVADLVIKVGKCRAKQVAQQIAWQLAKYDH